MDSLYGSLLYGPQPGAEGPEGPPAGRKKGPADDIFAEPPAGAAQQERVAGPEGPPTVEGPQPAPQGGKEPSATPLPQAFSAAKLMMPPVRKKAEPVGNKRVMPTLDMSKLQEEKEALLRQRASAEKKEATSSPATASSAGSTAGLGASRGAGLGATSSGATPATGSTASAGAASASAVSISSAGLYGSPDEEYDPAKPNDYDEFCRRRMRQKAEEEMARRREEALARQQAQTAAAKPPEPKEDDFATRMMKKMGWKEGQGCGKEAQGMTAPLIMKKVDRATAVITGGRSERPRSSQLGSLALNRLKRIPRKKC